METESKKQKYKKLERKIKNNESLILVYKKLTPICMTLFVLTAFFSFYTSINNIGNSYGLLYAGTLILLFVTLTLFYFSINKKEKQNKIIISKL
jgi:hypothetical protein